MMPRLLINSSKTAGSLALILSFCLATGAQSEQRHFSQAGASFDYPAGFVLSERSDPNAQQSSRTRPYISSMILVVAFRDAILTRAQLNTATETTTGPYISDVVSKLSTSKSPEQRDSACAAIGDASIGGVQVRGVMNGVPATAEIYAF